MSFAIDEAKAEELIRSSENKYTVSISAIEPTIGNFVPHYGNMGASGTIVIDRNVVLTEARRHLMTIRNKIVKSGRALKSADELSKEIEGMRGGSR